MQIAIFGVLTRNSVKCNTLMMAKKQTAPAAAPAAGNVAQMKVPPPENTSAIPSAYANIVEVLSMNYIDVRLAFNEVILEGDKIRAERRANIVMPVPAFLAMIQILNANAQNLMMQQQQQAAAANAHIRGQIEAMKAKQEK